MEIRTLPDFLINQIAAGEVIERPAFIIKELIENAIDAKATEINIIVKDGGKQEIIVSDNGMGMTSDQLKLCIKRHATSKLPKNNLNDIKFLGFRGEALPSIASISELKIENTDRPSKIIIYPLAIFLLFVFGYLNFIRKDLSTRS